jgi:prevent-host-death family protein
LGAAFFLRKVIAFDDIDLYNMYMSEDNPYLDPLSVAQAREQFPSLLEAAESGVQTIIARRGKPVAVLGPLEMRRPRTRLSLHDIQGTGANLWGASASRHVDTLRREWGE